jgi:hypothetical protein
MTGNKPQRNLSGEHLLLLVYYKMIWPQASYFECIAFIANESSNGRIFNEMSISRVLCSLGYTRKVTSTMAYQALTERNLLRCQIFWDEPWPVGVNGFPMQHLIDADEFGLHFNAANSKYGLAPRGMRIRKPGNYDRGSFKLTIILALEAGDPPIAPGLPGSMTKPRVWAQISEVPGTTSAAYYTYNANANPALHKLLIHDNLSSHKSVEVLEAVQRQGHRVVCRPPYRPQDGPVEFAINQVCCRLVKQWSEVSDLQTRMQTVIQQIINTEINGMDATFLKCRYIK